MEDDERSVDWAPSKIRALGDQLNDLAREVGNQFSEVDRRRAALGDVLERMSEHFTTRLDQLDREVKNIRQVMEGTRKDQERGNEGMGGRIYDLEHAVARMEGVISDEVKAAWSATVRELDEDRIPQFGAPWANDEFSPPVGGRKYQLDDDDLIDGIPDVHGRRAGDVEDRTHLRGTGAPARNGGLFSIGTPPKLADDGGVVPLTRNDEIEKVFKRGYELGWSAAIDEAESRITASLDKVDIYGRYRDEILSALRGVQPPPVRKIRDNPQG
jgi:hypothetical protein